MGKLIDLTHKTFGKLTVIRQCNTASKHIKWECSCSCGNTHNVRGSHLKAGLIRSCGCISKSHGMTKTPEYKTWQSIKDRCYRKKKHDYFSYGGRGITVCDRWLESFENFYTDMGTRPSETHSIDRIDNNGNYSPENCRWATKKEQARNNRGNHILTYKGESNPIIYWAELFGIKYSTLKERIVRGWSVYDALNTPVGGFHHTRSG